MYQGLSLWSCLIKRHAAFDGDKVRLTGLSPSPEALLSDATNCLTLVDDIDFAKSQTFSKPSSPHTTHNSSTLHFAGSRSFSLSFYELIWRAHPLAAKKSALFPEKERNPPSISSFPPKMLAPFPYVVASPSTKCVHTYLRTFFWLFSVVVN